MNICKCDGFCYYCSNESQIPCNEIGKAVVTPAGSSYFLCEGCKKARLGKNFPDVLPHYSLIEQQDFLRKEVDARYGRETSFLWNWGPGGAEIKLRYGGEDGGPVFFVNIAVGIMPGTGTPS